MFAPPDAVVGPVFITEMSAMLPIALEAEPLVLPGTGSAGDEVLALMTTLPGASCAVITRLSAAVPAGAIDEPVHEALVGPVVQVKPPPAALTIVPPLTLMVRFGAPAS